MAGQEGGQTPPTHDKGAQFVFLRVSKLRLSISQPRICSDKIRKYHAIGNGLRICVGVRREVHDERNSKSECFF